MEEFELVEKMSREAIEKLELQTYGSSKKGVCPVHGHDFLTSQTLEAVNEQWRRVFDHAFSSSIGIASEIANGSATVEEQGTVFTLIPPLSVFRQREVERYEKLLRKCGGQKYILLPFVALLACAAILIVLILLHHFYHDLY